tara:strand:+ start:579 stop:821 length:243 start_codon:yes stop_codon:yes gene_type:complete
MSAKTVGIWRLIEGTEYKIGSFEWDEYAGRREKYAVNQLIKDLNKLLDDSPDFNDGDYELLFDSDKIRLPLIGALQEDKQ